VPCRTVYFSYLCSTIANSCGAVRCSFFIFVLIFFSPLISCSTALFIFIIYYTILTTLYHIQFIIPYWIYYTILILCVHRLYSCPAALQQLHRHRHRHRHRDRETHTHIPGRGVIFSLTRMCLLTRMWSYTHIHTPHTHTHIKSGRHVHCWGNSFKRDLIPFQKRPNTVSKETCSVSTFEATVYFIIIIIIYYIIIIILLIYIYIYTHTHTYTSICTYKNIYIYTHKTHRHTQTHYPCQKRPNTVSKET